MTYKDPYQIVKHRHVTEKAQVLANLKDAESNASVRRCESPKAVFIVDVKANKQQIKKAVEEIYKEKNIKVTAVNTIHVQGKVKRRRGRLVTMPSFKKAVVTLEKGDTLDDV